MKLTLITRPEGDAERTAAAVREAGYEALIAPLFEVHALQGDWSCLNAARMPGAVLATSANALRFCPAEQLKAHLALPVFTVGDATAAAARTAGFRQVFSANGNAESLASLIKEQVEKGTVLLQLAGRPRRDAALQALQGQYALQTVETYETITTRQLPANALEALQQKKLYSAMHFSPRAAQVFMDLAETAGLIEEARSLRHICISQAAADPRMMLPEIAAGPTLRAMLQTLSNA